MDKVCDTVNWERFAGLNFRVFQFSGVPRKFFREYKCFSLIILSNEYLWPRQHKNISAKNFDGAETTSI